MAYNKLSRPSDQRKAMLRSQVTALLWKGKIVTTKARAKEVQRIAEKQITKAIAQHKNCLLYTSYHGRVEALAEGAREAGLKL